MSSDNDTRDSLGFHIRKLRQTQHRTLQEIADACGFTPSLLSKIETGKVIPPVATLVKIAKSLGTSIGSLLEEDKQVDAVFTEASQVVAGTVSTENGYEIFPFATEHKEKKMQPFIFVARKGEVKEHHFSHDGEEFVYVISGEMKFQVGHVEYRLKAGDSLYFNAYEVHQMIPVSDEVRYIDIFV